MQHTPDPALRCFQLALMLLVMCGLGTAAAQRMSSWQQAESVSTLAYEPGQRVRFHFGLAADWDAGDGRRGFAGVLTIRSEERGTVSIDGIRFRMDAEIADSWNGEVSTYEDGFSLRPDPWNVTLEYGQARSFGLTGTYAGAFGPPHDFRMAGRVTVPSPEPAAIAEHCPFDAEITHVSPAGSEGSRFLAEVLVMNTGPVESSWAVLVDASVESVLNAAHIGMGGGHLVVPEAWNSVIQPGGTVSFTLVSAEVTASVRACPDLQLDDPDRERFIRSWLELDPAGRRAYAAGRLVWNHSNFQVPP